MKRTLIGQGKGGCTIYLPKKWVLQRGLHEGNEVEVTEVGSGLLVHSGTTGKKEGQFDLTNENRHDLLPLLVHYYRQGYDIITISHVTPTDCKEIKSIIKEVLLGFDMTEQTGKTCVIANISEPSSEKYETMMRRLFFIIKETQTLLVEDAHNGKYEHMEEISELKNQHDKFVNFCRRILVRGKSGLDSLSTWELLTFLMHIEHAHLYLYTFLHSTKTKPSKSVQGLLATLRTYFELYYQAYFKKDTKYIHELNRLKTSYQFGTCLRLLEKSSGKETIVLSYIREIFRLIQVGASPILSDLCHKTQQTTPEQEEQLP